MVTTHQEAAPICSFHLINFTTMLPLFVQILPDAILEQVMLKMHRHVEILEDKRARAPLGDGEADTLDKLKAELEELTTFFIRNWYISKELMPVVRMFIKYRHQIESLRNVHDYNYNKLSLCIKTEK